MFISVCVCVCDVSVRGCLIADTVNEDAAEAIRLHTWELVKM